MADGTGYATCAQPAQRHSNGGSVVAYTWTPGQKVAGPHGPKPDRANALGRIGNKYFGKADWGTFIGGPSFGPAWATNTSLSLVLIRRKA
jgi:hypothetical protein